MSMQGCISIAAMSVESCVHLRRAVDERGTLSSRPDRQRHRRSRGTGDVTSCRRETFAAANPPAPTCRVDEREPPTGDRRGGLTHERRDGRSANRERDGQDLPMHTNDAFHLLTREGQHDGHGLPRSPPEPTGRLRRYPLVPGDLTFESAEVIECRLYLDEQQRPGGRVECQEVDPAMGSAGSDLDLAACHPPRHLQAPIHIGRASCVHAVAHPDTARKDRWSPDQPDIESKRR